MITRPMLAETVEDVNSINYPVLVSPKLDGIRILKIDGNIVTRKFKPLPNTYTRQWLEKYLPDGFDGELILRHDMSFNACQSAFMSQDGEPDFKFMIFDYVSSSLDTEFQYRFADLRETMIKKVWMQIGTLQMLDIVPHYFVNSAEELMVKEAEFVSQGYEGLMLRRPSGKYKCGRSTVKEELLLKVKRFEDSEAVVLDVLELMHNSNEKETDELGMSKRSKAQAGMVPAGMLGKFAVRDIKSGIEFEIGTGLGLTQELRKEIWDNKTKYLGKLVKYKFQPAGVKEKPRFPVWLGFRHEDDL